MAYHSAAAYLFVLKAADTRDMSWNYFSSSGLAPDKVGILRVAMLLLSFFQFDVENQHKLTIIKLIN